MSKSPANKPTRRSFLKTSGATAVAASSMLSTAPQLFAAQDSTIKVALVGCGGRGSGAATQALSVEGQGPIQLVAMADVFEKNLANKHKQIAKDVPGPEKVAVVDDQKFIGFDAYKQAMDCLRPGDVVILTTPCAFRWLHYSYAIEKGLNVFMEKPLTADAPTSLRMLELNEKAKAKNLKVGVGLMCRHSVARQELFDRIQNGELGDIVYCRAYRMAGPTATAFVKPNTGDLSELMYQIANFHGFLWLSGGAVSDFLIHNIDECCWMKDAWPVSAQAVGGRHYRGDYIDQNFDSYAIEYTFPDGTKFVQEGRTVPGCYNEFAAYVHGSKGLGVISGAGHHPAKSRIYKGHNMDDSNIAWAAAQPEESPYQLEWNHFIDAIRNDKPYNEVERGVMASAVTSMGRMAAHTGQKWTFENFMKVPHEFAPGLADLTLDGPSPLPAKADGKYPIPLPGLVKDREYA
ncbi:MAG: Gfo/Idh/MocA family protein [Planctomycetaceae bacterium]